MADIIKDDAPYASFARRLRRLRREHKLSREEFARECGIAARTVINYENGTRIPVADKAIKMARLFGLTVEELLGIDFPEEEKQKAESLAEIRQMYGRTGERQAEALLEGTSSLFAGGELTAEQRTDFILEMQKLFIVATEEARGKYTPKKYRTKEKEEASKERLMEVARIDSVLSERRRKSGVKIPFLDDDE